MTTSSRAGFVAVTGLEQMKRNIELSEQIFDQALDAGEDAAAAIYKRALQEAAPVGETGDLAASILIYESRDRKAVFKSSSRRRLLVGPGKRKKAGGPRASRGGFYGFFLEFGTSKMAARPWIRPAIDAVAAEAQAAGIAAFQKYVAEQMARMRT